MKILIADDSVFVCDRMSTILGDIPGVEIVGRAYDVPGALSSIDQLKPDVVILDVKMPGGSGFDVLRSVKREGHPPVVIMLTNYPSPQYRDRSFAAGADYFFDKSNEFEKVAGVLDDLKSMPQLSEQ